MSARRRHKASVLGHQWGGLWEDHRRGHGRIRCCYNNTCEDRCFPLQASICEAHGQHEHPRRDEVSLEGPAQQAEREA